MTRCRIIKKDLNSSKIPFSDMITKEMAPKKIVIVGGGLVGSLAALVLADSPEKYQVHVYELREDLRQAPHVRGRSINLALSTRGLATLQKAGVAKQVQEMLIPMYGRMLHSPEGALTEVPYGVFGEAINSVDRRKLNEMLLTEAEKRDNVRLFFQHAVETCDFDANELTFINKYVLIALFKMRFISHKMVI